MKNCMTIFLETGYSVSFFFKLVFYAYCYLISTYTFGNIVFEGLLLNFMDFLMIFRVYVTRSIS